jgi:hypothetical protein
MIRTYGMAHTPTVASNRSTITRSAGLFKLDQALEITLPTSVRITVRVTDSSGQEVQTDLITATSNTQSVSTPNDLLLRLLDQDPVWVMAKRYFPEPGVSAKSKAVAFVFAQMQSDMNFDLQLPYFDTGNVTVKGRFVPAADIDPRPVLTRGSMRSNVSIAQPVGGDGNFTFVNDKAVLLSDSLVIYGLVFSDDKRMFKPEGGAYTKKLKKGVVLTLGDIIVKPHEIKIDPITIRVVDRSGRPIPKDDLKVFIGDTAAGWKQNAFAGTWTIKRAGDRVDLKAEMTLPDGTTVSNPAGSAILSADQFDLLGTPVPPAPITITLPVQLALDIDGISAIRLPVGKPKPQKIKIVCPGSQASEWFDLEAPFFLACKGPFRLGESITIEGKAKHSGDPLLYEGSATAMVTDKSKLNVGTLTVGPQIAKGFVTISGMKALAPYGSGPPTMGQPMKAAAVVTVGDYDGPLPVIEWKRLSDGYSDLQFKTHVTKGQAVSVQTDMPALAQGNRVRDDVIELRVSDDIDQEVLASLPFSWEIGDEFRRLTLTSVKKGKTARQFSIGEKISVASKWEIAKENGNQRDIVYSARGSEFHREAVVVREGAPFAHEAVFDTNGAGKGKMEIRVDLINDQPATLATGAVSVHLKEPKDRIVSAGAGAGSTSAGRTKKFTQGDPLYVNATILAAEGKDGNRTLNLNYRGRTVLSESFDLKGDGRVSKSFQINSDKLDASNHVFTLDLYDTDGKRQDHKVVRVKLAKKQQNTSGAGQGGLQNVNCTGDTINIKVWDHGSQDGDIITLQLGGRKVLGGFDLNACGGSEPFAAPCAIMNLPFPAGTQVPVTIAAHNEGSSSPNTAALKIEGGCTPETQHWGLKTGQSASIFISRVTGQAQSSATSSRASGQQGQQPGGTQAAQSVQSWP